MCISFARDCHIKGSKLVNMHIMNIFLVFIRKYLLIHKNIVTSILIEHFKIPNLDAINNIILFIRFLVSAAETQNLC